MSEHPIQGIMDTTMQKIKEMVDVNTIVGDPMTTPDGTTIIPISKVSFGFASGGADIATKNQTNSQPFAGGSGAGITITPIAFMVVSGADIRLIHVANNVTTVDKVVEMVPEIIDKAKAMFSKDKYDL